MQVGGDHLAAEPLGAARDPRALGRGLDRYPGAGLVAEHLGESVRADVDAAFEYLARFGELADLTFTDVHVDASMLHG